MDGNENVQKAKEYMNKMMAQKQIFLKIILYTVFVTLLVTVIFYWSSQLAKKNSDCSTMNSLYPDLASISSMGANDDTYNHPLCEYYMKSAYNCCCAGQFENDWVQLCALSNVIKQGCRVLDFEIYNINSKPVISVSNSTNNYEKGTYNYLAFDSVLQNVVDNAFSGATCPNPGDPLILFFRIMSSNTAIYDSMADTIGEILSNYVLGEKYSFEYEGPNGAGQNIGSVSIREFLGKIIIVVADSQGGIFRSTKLWEYVNIAGNEPFLYVSSEHDVIYASDPDDMLEHNRQMMTICTPNLSATADNYNPTAVMTYGVQMPLMSFQTNDTNLQVYNNQFSNAGHAFIRKPESMRYISVTVEAPDPIPVDQQMGTTTQTGGSYQGEKLWSVTV